MFDEQLNFVEKLFIIIFVVITLLILFSYVILLTAESWYFDVLDDADCVDVGPRAVHGQAASIQQPT